MVMSQDASTNISLKPENKDEQNSSDNSVSSSELANQNKSETISPQNLPIILDCYSNKERIDTRIRLTPLSNGAVGKRTGGEPESSANQLETSVKVKNARFPATRGSSMRAVRKRLPGDAGKQSSSNSPAACKYQCRSCKSTNVSSRKKTSAPSSSTCRSPSPEPPFGLECQNCGGRTMERRGTVRKSTGGLFVSSKSTGGMRGRKSTGTVFTVSSDESNSSDDSHVAKPEGNSCVPEDCPKRIKCEAVEKGKEDHTDYFMTYVMSLLRSLPRNRSLRLQKEIITLILNDRVKPSDSSD